MLKDKPQPEAVWVRGKLQNTGLQVIWAPQLQGDHRIYPLHWMQCEGSTLGDVNVCLPLN